jgi:hypothetical protein
VKAKVRPRLAGICATRGFAQQQSSSAFRSDERSGHDCDHALAVDPVAVLGAKQPRCRGQRRCRTLPLRDTLSHATVLEQGGRSQLEGVVRASESRAAPDRRPDVSGGRRVWRDRFDLDRRRTPRHRDGDKALAQTEPELRCRGRSHPPSSRGSSRHEVGRDGRSTCPGAHNDLLSGAATSGV